MENHADWENISSCSRNKLAIGDERSKCKISVPILPDNYDFNYICPISIQTVVFRCPTLITCTMAITTIKIAIITEVTTDADKEIINKTLAIKINWISFGTHSFKHA